MMNPLESNGLVYNNQVRYDTVPAATTPFNPTMDCQTSLFNPIYNIPQADCLVKPTIQSLDSSVTFNSESNGINGDFLRPVSSSVLSKRSRQESVAGDNMPSQKRCSDPLMFLGQNMSFNGQHHNNDIDRLISNHVEIMRKEIEEKRKTQGRQMMEAIKIGLMKTLKAKDEEINHIYKLNLFLEEKVKSLSVENQIWRDVAESNEATVNVLRSNLHQVLSAMERNRWEEQSVADDAQSCCGSNNDVERDEEQCILATDAHDKKRLRRETRSMCRSCGKGEASVLVLPCRHMCLCILCGTSHDTCPVCKSPKNASLHVNLSS